MFRLLSGLLHPFARFACRPPVFSFFLRRLLWEIFFFNFSTLLYHSADSQVLCRSSWWKRGSFLGPCVSWFHKLRAHQILLTVFFSSKIMNAFWRMREGSFYVRFESANLYSNSFVWLTLTNTVQWCDIFSGITIFRGVLDAHRVVSIFEPNCEVPIHWKQARCLEGLLNTLNCDLIKS